MLRVNIEVTYTDGGLRQIAELQIVNVSDLDDVSDYQWYLYAEGRLVDSGEVKGHSRDDGWAPLVQRTLERVTRQAAPRRGEKERNRGSRESLEGRFDGRSMIAILESEHQLETEHDDALDLSVPMTEDEARARWVRQQDDR
jgi:hypothetical protein